jgi:hypothetical protein
MRYRSGELVKVSARPHPGHNRVPAYLKGKTGRVERLQGPFPNPEGLAYGGDGLPAQPLYLIGFASGELWPDRGDPGHLVLADIYEHWLEEP